MVNVCKCYHISYIAYMDPMGYVSNLQMTSMMEMFPACGRMIYFC